MTCCDCFGLVLLECWSCTRSLFIASFVVMVSPPRASALRVKSPWYPTPPPPEWTKDPEDPRWWVGLEDPLPRVKRDHVVAREVGCKAVLLLTIMCFSVHRHKQLYQVEFEVQRVLKWLDRLGRLLAESGRVQPRRRDGSMRWVVRVGKLRPRNARKRGQVRRRIWRRGF